MAQYAGMPVSGLKIVFSSSSIGRGGKERQLFILARALSDHGCCVKILTTNIFKENYIKEYGFDLKLIFEYQGKNQLRKYWNFKQIILADPPDILVSWDSMTSIYSLLLYKKCRCLWINASIQHGIRLWKLSHLSRSLVCRLSPVVMANSFAGLKANNLKPGKNRFVLYNGIEKKFVNEMSQEEIHGQRQRLIPGYSKNPGTVYVSVANFVPYKDYFTVLKALSELKKLKPFYYFVIGDGPLRKEVENKIRDYDLQDRIILTGRIENVKDYLFVSDVLIHSSRGEGVSNAILEGMFAGLPVIATNVGGVPETVYPGSSLLFPYRDDRALLNCLLKAHETFIAFDPQSEGYKKHLEKFSVDIMVKRFEKIIGDVIVRK